MNRVVLGLILKADFMEMNTIESIKSSELNIGLIPNILIDEKQF